MRATFSDLPPEIVEAILRNVEPGSADSLAQLALVSKSFSEIVKPLLYTSISVTSTENFYLLHMGLMKADRKLRALVRSVQFTDIDSKWSRGYYWTEDTIRFLRGFLLNVVDACPNLNKLFLSGGPISTSHAFFRDGFTFHPGHRHITHLHICTVEDEGIATPSLVSAVCTWPALRVLELPKFTGEPRWRREFHSDRHARGTMSELATVLAPACSPITSLFFKSPQGLDNLSLAAMLFLPARLEHLSLCTAFWPDALEEIMTRIGSKLVSLRLNTTRYLGFSFEDEITDVLAQCTALKSLQLDNSLYRDAHVDVLPSTLENLTLTWLDGSKCTLLSLAPLVADRSRFPQFCRLEAHKLPAVSQSTRGFLREDIELLEMTCREEGVKTLGTLFDPEVKNPFSLDELWHALPPRLAEENNFTYMVPEGKTRK